MSRRATLTVAVLAALLVVGGTGVLIARQADDKPAPAAVVTMLPGPQPDPLVIQVETTEARVVAEAPATTAAPATAAPAAPAATVAPEPDSGPVTPRNDTGSVYAALGTWVDVFDWDPDHTNGSPRITPSAVDRMAAVGVKTLYIQAARPEDEASPGDLVHPEILSSFIQRAHANGIAVVGWYLPHLSDIADDMRHLQAMIDFAPGGQRFESISLDIEWRNSVPDHDERSARLVDLSQRLRAAASGGGMSVSATVMPPVVTDVINPAFWPRFPWNSIASLYDVWLPMSYWTNRSDDSPYRDAHRYTSENISLLRANLGDPGAPVHPIGGIGDKATLEDYQGFMAASSEQGAIGVSIYDFGTTAADAWPILRG
ncbi:MAG TPA: hypothetical protein VM121_04655 [Acidimicrobiales bacterium]|nr:hypothetical protein [Acidimicrobiales bacterium]